MNKCKHGCGLDGVYFTKSGEWCCDKNPSKCPSIKEKLRIKKANYIPWNKGKKVNSIPWNKGKTFEECLGKEKADHYRQKLSAARKGKRVPISVENELIRRDKIRRSINARYELGWQPKAGRCKKIKYFSKCAGWVSLDGTWELEVAKFLDKGNVIWERNRKRFIYTKPDGSSGYYTPDFYFVDRDCYLEVKGYETELDRCKWRDFPKWLIVWKKPEILMIKREGQIEW
jgi:hypothetical protein